MKKPLKKSDEYIIRCVEQLFGLEVQDLKFIPEGEVSWIYRCNLSDTAERAVIRISKRKPKFSDSKIIIALTDQQYPWIPEFYPVKHGRIWGKKDGYYFFLQHYVDSSDDSHVFHLKDQYLEELGRALRQLHDTQLSTKVKIAIPKQKFKPKWPVLLKKFIKEMHRPQSKQYTKVQNLVLSHEKELLALVSQLNALGKALKKQKLKLVLTHGDVHPHNILRPKNDHLYIIDWETAMFSHRENDLMYFDDRQLKIMSKGYGDDLLKNKALIEYYRTFLLIRALFHFGCKKAFKGGSELERSEGLGSFKELLSGIDTSLFTVS